MQNDQKTDPKIYQICTKYHLCFSRGCGIIVPEGKARDAKPSPPTAARRCSPEKESIKMKETALRKISRIKDYIKKEMELSRFMVGTADGDKESIDYWKARLELACDIMQEIESNKS